MFITLLLSTLSKIYLFIKTCVEFMTSFYVTFQHYSIIVSAICIVLTMCCCYYINTCMMYALSFKICYCKNAFVHYSNIQKMSQTALNK